MPILKVANKAQSAENFKVIIANGTEIKNYKHTGAPASAGEVQSAAVNNKINTYFKQAGDKNITPQNALNLSAGKYEILDKARRLDGNAGDLSAKDMAKLRKSPSIWKKYGISNIKYDGKSGTTGIYSSPQDKNPFVIKVK